MKNENLEEKQKINRRKKKNKSKIIPYASMIVGCLALLLTGNIVHKKVEKAKKDMYLNGLKSKYSNVIESDEYDSVYSDFEFDYSEIDDFNALDIISKCEKKSDSNILSDDITIERTNGEKITLKQANEEFLKIRNKYLDGKTLYNEDIYDMEKYLYYILKMELKSYVSKRTGLNIDEMKDFEIMKIWQNEDVDYFDSQQKIITTSKEVGNPYCYVVFKNNGLNYSYGLNEFNGFFNNTCSIADMLYNHEYNYDNENTAINTKVNNLINIYIEYACYLPIREYGLSQKNKQANLQNVEIDDYDREYPAKDSNEISSNEHDLLNVITTCEKENNCNIESDDITIKKTNGDTITLKQANEEFLKIRNKYLDGKKIWNEDIYNMEKYLYYMLQIELKSYISKKTGFNIDEINDFEIAKCPLEEINDNYDFQNIMEFKDYCETYCYYVKFNNNGIKYSFGLEENGGFIDTICSYADELYNHKLNFQDEKTPIDNKTQYLIDIYNNYVCYFPTKEVGLSTNNKTKVLK